MENKTIDCSFSYEQFHQKHQNVFRYLLEKTLKNAKAPRILEIGCWAGQSTNVICDYLKTKGAGSLEVIDTFEGVVGTPLEKIAGDYSIKGIFIENMQKCENFPWPLEKIHHGPSQLAYELFDDRSFDLIFIDGDHRYEKVKSDIEDYLPKVKSGGIICGHDYDSNYYDESLVHLDFADNKHHGVIKAVHEIFNQNEFNHDFVFWWHKTI